MLRCYSQVFSRFIRVLWLQVHNSGSVNYYYSQSTSTLRLDSAEHIFVKVGAKPLNRDAVIRDAVGASSAEMQSVIVASGQFFS